MKNKKDLTFTEACKLLKKSRKTISRYIKKGLLNPDKVKTEKGTLEYRFSQSELESLRKPDTIGQTTGHIKKTDKNEDDTLSLFKNNMKLIIYVSITNDEQKAEINRLHPLNKMRVKLI